jgi:hypothetical protein
MAAQTLLTNLSKLYNVENMYYGPSSVVPPFYTRSDSFYCFLASVDPWTDDENPPAPRQDQKYIKQIMKNVFVMKQIQSGDISPVLQRIDWTTDTVYEYYQDDINMIELGDNGYLVHNFYVKNRYDQVFKCLWNNNGSPSTKEPYFEPGSYQTNNMFIGTDGYKWKYIYTIDTGLKVKFMDKNWIPVPIGIGYIPNPLLNPNNLPLAPGIGNIDVINVTDGGSGYDTSNAIITVTVTGDGTGATGTAVVSDGTIQDIIVTSPGTNYSYANVSIQSALGSGATAIAPASPIGGHGLDPVSELGCSNVMLTCQFDGSENEYIPTDITYYQMGIVINPIAESSSPYNANGAIYKTSTNLVVASGFGEYISDEIIFQGASVENSTFSAKIVSFDPATNIINTINTQGTLRLNDPIFGDSTKTARTLLSYNTPDLVAISGYPVFIENRSGIQRSADGIEQFKVVLSY